MMLLHEGLDGFQRGLVASIHRRDRLAMLIPVILCKPSCLLTTPRVGARGGVHVMLSIKLAVVRLRAHIVAVEQ